MIGRVRGAVEIAAAVDEVFAYLDDPENSLALVPQLVEVKNVERLPNGGHRIEFVTVGRRGTLCEWVSEHVERVPNDLVVVRARTEGVTTTATRRFEPTAVGTRLVGEVAYEIELPWPQRALVPVMLLQWRRPARKHLGALLATVKARVEGR